MSQLVEKLKEHIYIAIPEKYKIEHNSLTAQEQILNFINDYFSFIQNTIIERQGGYDKIISPDSAYDVR